jgi:RNA polymerase sigma-70 factor (ECF subfamily)
MRHDDTAQFTVLWTAAQPTVMAFIRSVVGSAADAEDTLQEVAYAIASRFDEYDAARPFAAWAIGIAKYKLMEWRRSVSHDRVLFQSHTIEQIADGYAQVSAEAGGATRALDHCMSKLGAKPKRVLELRYVQQMKPSAIARELGTTSNTISVLLHRTRETLRDCVKRHLAMEAG